MRPDFRDLDLNIASARVVLSLLAMLSLYVDPSAGGLFHLDTYALTTLICHFAYSVATYFALKGRCAPRVLPKVSIALDLCFATAVALFTEGSTSPSYVFFVFAIIAVGFRKGFHATLAVTLCGVALYLLVIALSDGLTNFYMMRAAYLAIAGYLIGFFGQQRANFEARVRELEMKTERQTIARSLHDGYVQALAGVNIRLETCRELLKRGRTAGALGELTELQFGVAREFDEVRAYVRSLVELDRTMVGENSAAAFETQFNVRAAFTARGLMVEQILQIVLEGMRNARRHAKADYVTIDVHEDRDGIRIMIYDDGIGFHESKTPPWAIASRVAEFGGSLRISGDEGGGARLEIEMPTA